MKRLTTRAAMLALLTLACDSATGPGPCPESVAAQVQSPPGGGAPEFRWSPTCRISYLLVSGAEQDQVLWMILATEQGFLPGVQYGALPAGATESVPAVPLVAGGEYFLTLGTLVGDDAVMVHATSLFER